MISGGKTKASPDPVFKTVVLKKGELKKKKYKTIRQQKCKNIVLCRFKNKKKCINYSNLAQYIETEHRKSKAYQSGAALLRHVPTI